MIKFKLYEATLDTTLSHGLHSWKYVGVYIESVWLRDLEA